MSRVVLALMLAAFAASCGQGQSGPISAQGCQATATTSAGPTRVAEASPADSTIKAVWDQGAQAHAGQPFQVRLVMDSRMAGRQMRMRAIREGTGETVEASIDGTVSGQLAEFPARLTFPRPGCWSADFSSGTAGGEIVFSVA